jgi:hypothetical protein
MLPRLIVFIACPLITLCLPTAYTRPQRKRKLLKRNFYRRVTLEDWFIIPEYEVVTTLHPYNHLAIRAIIRDHINAVDHARLAVSLTVFGRELNRR